MKKKLVFGLVMILALACVLVSCNSEVSAENGAGSAKTGSIVIGQEASKGIGYSVDYSYEVENLYWFYTAEKKDDGYRNGETRNNVGDLIQVAVKDTAGLNGTTLPNNYAYGLWDLKFYGYESASDAGTENKVVFYGSVSSFLVDKDHNYTDVNLEVSHAATKIEFGTISFKFDHEIASTANLTLSITDGAKGSGDVKNIGSTEKTWTLSGPDSDGNYTVSFSNIDYVLAENADITGEHTMVFTLSQVLSGGGNTTIEAANYTLVFNVNAGTTTTISGDMTKNVETGDITINSAALSVPVILSPKVVPIDSTSITGEGASAVATVKTQTTVTNGDLSVTYPVGAVIASVSATTIDSATSTSDASTGFVYVSNVPSASIVIETYQTVKQYELTLNVDSSNDKLLTITKKIGKDLTIDAIYHNGTLMETSAAVSPAEEHEYYSYDSTTGVLTLYVKTASPFDIIMKADASVEIIHVNAVAATCTTSGMQAYDYYMDGETKIIVGGKTEDELVLPATGHSIESYAQAFYGGNYMCYGHSATCSVCNTVVGGFCADSDTDGICDTCNGHMYVVVNETSDLKCDSADSSNIKIPNGIYKITSESGYVDLGGTNGKATLINSVVIDLNGHNLRSFPGNSASDPQFKDYSNNDRTFVLVLKDSSESNSKGKFLGAWGGTFVSGDISAENNIFKIICEDGVEIDMMNNWQYQSITSSQLGNMGSPFALNVKNQIIIEGAIINCAKIAVMQGGSLTFRNCTIHCNNPNDYNLISGVSNTSSTISFENCTITTAAGTTTKDSLINASSDVNVVFDSATTVN